MLAFTRACCSCCKQPLRFNALSTLKSLQLLMFKSNDAGQTSCWHCLLVEANLRVSTTERLLKTQFIVSWVLSISQTVLQFGEHTFWKSCMLALLVSDAVSATQRKSSDLAEALWIGAVVTFKWQAQSKSKESACCARVVKYLLPGPEITYIHTVCTKYMYISQHTPRLWVRVKSANTV